MTNALICELAFTGDGKSTQTAIRADVPPDFRGRVQTLWASPKEDTGIFRVWAVDEHLSHVEQVARRVLARESRLTASVVREIAARAGRDHARALIQRDARLGLLTAHDVRHLSKKV